MIGNLIKLGLISATALWAVNLIADKTKSGKIYLPNFLRKNKKKKYYL